MPSRAWASTRRRPSRSLSSAASLERAASRLVVGDARRPSFLASRPPLAVGRPTIAEQARDGHGSRPIYASARRECALTWSWSCAWLALGERARGERQGKWSPRSARSARWGLRPMARARQRARSSRPISATQFPEQRGVRGERIAPPRLSTTTCCVTADGYERLRAELEALRTVRRAALTEQLREAREDGDPDNPVLFDLLEEQAQLEGRINLLEAQIAAARVVGPRGDGRLGSEAACAYGTATAVTSPSTTWSGRSSPTSATAACRSGRQSVARCSVGSVANRRRRDSARTEAARDPVGQCRRARDAKEAA